MLYTRVAPIPSAGPVPTDRAITFDEGLVFHGVALPAAPVAPGAILVVRTAWTRQAALHGVAAVGFVLVDASSRLVPVSTEWIGPLEDPAHLWPVGETVTVDQRPLIPKSVAPGVYVLAMRVGLWNGETLAVASCDDPQVVGDRMLCRLGPVRIASAGR
jgi:hypothetical protein